MRKITPTQIALFLSLLAVILTLGVAGTALLLGAVPLGDFRGVVLILAAILLTYLFAFAAYRLFLHLFPLLPGDIPPNSRQEFIYHIYLMFFLMLFYPIMRSGVVPLPLLRLVYLTLGAKLGDNTYSSGIILDPIFVEVGANTLIGQYAVLVPHAIENERLSHRPIKIGDNVTIGAHAVVLAGVTIGDNALVATGAIVTKGTRIGSGEVWGGVPARRLSGGEKEQALASV
jgi:acetyltransferase-like isoleucine patch superfamily enzyme